MYSLGEHHLQELVYHAHNFSIKATIYYRKLVRTRTEVYGWGKILYKHYIYKLLSSSGKTAVSIIVISAWFWAILFNYLMRPATAYDLCLKSRGYATLLASKTSNCQKQLCSGGISAKPNCLVPLCCHSMEGPTDRYELCCSGLHNGPHPADQSDNVFLGDILDDLPCSI